jgi:hypothetical protein
LTVLEGYSIHWLIQLPSRVEDFQRVYRQRAEYGMEPLEP